MSTIVRVTYHKDADGWWADSRDVEGFVASGADLSEVRQLVREGLPFYLEDDSIDIVEESPWPSGVVFEVHLNNSLAGASLTSTGTWRSSPPQNVVDNLGAQYRVQGGRPLTAAR